MTTSSAFSQIDYSLKVETGLLQFIRNSIDIDPGNNWKGYYLEGQNGMDVNIIKDIGYNDKLFAGAGLGYSNFEGTDGLSVFADLEFLPLNTRLRPLLNIKCGYHHIWNQYENGTGTASGDIALGLNFRLNKNLDIYAKSGIWLSQQSFLFPIRLGVRL
ncbi:MAG: hypothetical protein ACQEQ0_04335 [Bacteroidota bacterium]